MAKTKYCLAWTTEINFLTVLEAGSLWSGYSVICFLWRLSFSCRWLPSHFVSTWWGTVESGWWGQGEGEEREEKQRARITQSLHVVSLTDSFLLTLRRWVVCLTWGAQSCWDIPFRDSPALLMSPCSSCYWLFRSGISTQSTEPCRLRMHSDTSC